MKKLSAREFVEMGLMQEINRRFLNPMGLTMEIMESDNSFFSGRVIDFRDCEEGVWLEEISIDKIISVDKLLDSKKVSRVNKFGWNIQPANDCQPKTKGN